MAKLQQVWDFKIRHHYEIIKKKLHLFTVIVIAFEISGRRLKLCTSIHISGLNIYMKYNIQTCTYVQTGCHIQSVAEIRQFVYYYIYIIFIILYIILLYKIQCLNRCLEIGLPCAIEGKSNIAVQNSVLNVLKSHKRNAKLFYIVAEDVYRYVRPTGLVRFV